MPLLNFPQKDIDLLRAMVNQFRKTRVTVPIRTPIDQEDHLSPDIQVFYPQTGAGIPALTEVAGTGTGAGDQDTPGSALCDIYDIEDDGTGGFILAFTGFEETVLNISSDAFSQDWVVAARAKSGKWVALAGTIVCP